MQLWLRDLGYPAVDGLSPRELAVKMNVSRRLVTYWLRRGWLREIDGKIPADSLRRFCRVHPEQIPSGRLDLEHGSVYGAWGIPQPSMTSSQARCTSQCPARLYLLENAVRLREITLSLRLDRDPNLDLGIHAGQRLCQCLNLVCETLQFSEAQNGEARCPATA